MGKRIPAGSLVDAVLGSDYRLPMAEVLSTFSLAPGDEAPGFWLPDADGHMHALDDVSGQQGTLVFFACNHCPYVIYLADAVGNLAKELKTQDIGVVAIASNDTEKYPADAPEHMGPFAREHGWDFPYLVDASQDVALNYGAACTPDFFLFDGARRLFYAGQFDNSRPKRGGEPDGADLREAVRRMLAGEPPIEKPKPSSGCNIKWKPGNEPKWFAKP